MRDIALLIIDMQVGNFSEVNRISKGNELLTKIKRLITKGRSARIPIIYIQNNGGNGDPDEYGTSGARAQNQNAPTISLT